MTLKDLLLVGLGGGVGAIARHVISQWKGTILLFRIPLTTPMINIVGSMILGFIIGIMIVKTPINEDLKNFLAIGFCGGFTTFSTFSSEAFNLLNAHAYGQLFFYILISFLGSILFYGLGFYIATKVLH